MRLFVVLLIVLSGCAQVTEPTTDGASVEVEDLAFRFQAWVDGAFEEVAAPVVAIGHPMRFDVECPGTCPLDIPWPDLADEQWLEVLVRWDGTQMANVTLQAEGATVQRGFDSARVLATEAPVTILADGPVQGRIAILGPDVPTLAGNHMLPNIVTYAPEQIGLGPCDSVERSEQGAQRCLRLGNAIGNTGDGALQAVLSHADGALTAAGLGAFDQRIHLRDGGYEDHEVGNADIHVAHGHFHYDGFAQFSLYQWAPETGLRGELAAEHKKSGFCFLDWGPMDDPDRRPQQDRVTTDCLVPGVSGWSMGVTAGWFDFYWAGLTDQYVDIADVPDGFYELVSVADWNDSLIETDEEDNAASAIIEIAGDTISVLETRAFYTLPEDTRQL